MDCSRNFSHTPKSETKNAPFRREITRFGAALLALQAAGRSAEALLVREALVFHFILHISLAFKSNFIRTNFTDQNFLTM